MSENITFKELDEKIQANIKKYIEDSETHIRLAGTEERKQACKEYALGLIEIYEQYSQMPAIDDSELDRVQIYNQTIKNLEKAKEEAEQKLGCCEGTAFVCYESMINVIIDLFEKCDYSCINALDVTNKLRKK